MPPPNTSTTNASPIAAANRSQFTKEIQSLKNSIHEYLAMRREGKGDHARKPSQGTRKRRIERSDIAPARRAKPSSKAKQSKLYSSSSQQAPPQSFLQESEIFLEKIMEQIQESGDHVGRRGKRGKTHVGGHLNGDGLMPSSASSSITSPRKRKINRDLTKTAHHQQHWHVTPHKKATPFNNNDNNHTLSSSLSISPRIDDSSRYTLKEIEQTFNIDTSPDTHRNKRTHDIHSDDDEDSLYDSASSSQSEEESSHNFTKLERADFARSHAIANPSHHHDQHHTAPSTKSSFLPTNPQPYVPPLRLNSSNSSAKHSQPHSARTPSQKHLSARSSRISSARHSLSARSSSRGRRSARSTVSARRKKPLQNHFSSQELVSIISKTLKAKKSQEAIASRDSVDSISRPSASTRGSFSPSQVPTSTSTSTVAPHAGRFRTLNLSSLLDELPQHKRRTRSVGSNHVTYALKSNPQNHSSQNDQQSTQSLALQLLKKRHKDIKEPVVHLRPSGKLTKLSANTPKRDSSQTALANVDAPLTRDPVHTPTLHHSQSSHENHEDPFSSSLAESLGLANAAIPSVDELIASVLQQSRVPNSQGTIHSDEGIFLPLNKDETNVEISVRSKSPQRSLKSLLKPVQTKPVQRRKKSVSWGNSIVEDEEEDSFPETSQSPDQHHFTEPPMHVGLQQDSLAQERSRRPDTPYSSSGDRHRISNNWIQRSSGESPARKATLYPPSFSALLSGQEDQLSRSGDVSAHAPLSVYEEHLPRSNQSTSMPLSVDAMTSSFREADAYINRIRVLRAYLNKQGDS
mmetsp:Transcript_10843/g.40478  ORF Transcript_10843/g.40478 Transcript_10843/m.40478 type:complete len:802 (-) Transcript_10843:38-2443(-)|eukprot:CAMPEP_0117441314 /NCGR_PEP_ID=MMETSP0759-20121206/3571_1 /TAXON_ID=63605 /ORGANISM="Percolomonas cosmopolitus, Strain WS" /LENGTH=801 /DNA_ID=CAMNT_0005233165 /DNA_START=235 /DNA_END=2640 /DNA_ORIENTATION=+